MPPETIVPDPDNQPPRRIKWMTMLRRTATPIRNHKCCVCASAQNVCLHYDRDLQGYVCTECVDDTTRAELFIHLSLPYEA